MADEDCQRVPEGDAYVWRAKGGITGRRYAWAEDHGVSLDRDVQLTMAAGNLAPQRDAKSATPGTPASAPTIRRGTLVQRTPQLQPDATEHGVD